MEDVAEVLTPNSRRYDLRPRTPSTPNTPFTPGKRAPRSTTTPATDKVQRTTKQTSTPLKTTNNTPCMPAQRISQSSCTPKQPLQSTVNSTPKQSLQFQSSGTNSTPKQQLQSNGTPKQPLQSQQSNGSQKQSQYNATNGTPKQQLQSQSNGTPKTEERMHVFHTPMSFKPCMKGNRVVPSPSRDEIWKQQLGFTDEPCGSDKENSSSEDDDNQQCQASLVEYRALQKELSAKNAQRDEYLLLIKTYKDKIRHLKSRVEREETNKRQQLKILRKSHETQMQEKENLLDNLQAIVTEQEDRIKELEDNTGSTPRKRTTRQTRHTPSENIAKLVDDIKQLQAEKSALAAQFNEVHLELTALREETTRESGSPTKDAGDQHNGSLAGVTSPNTSINTSSHCDKNSSQNNETCALKHTQSVTTVPGCSTDTEKQVEFLLAENKQLVQELTEAKNAHTKAMTVSKLGTHRQQQLEEEIKKLKQRSAELEEDVVVKSKKVLDLERTKTELASVTEDNTRLQASVQDLQAQIFGLQARSQELVKVNKVKQAESESLKKQNESSRLQLKELHLECDYQKQQIHTSNTQIQNLERMLKLTEREKEVADHTLLKQLESMDAEHKTSFLQLKESLEKEKQECISMHESKLALEHKEELQTLVESLNSKHNTELKHYEDSLMDTKSKHQEQLTKMESEKQQQVSKLETESSKTREEMNNQVTRFEGEMARVERKFRLECKQLEEDLTIAKQVAVNQLREEMQREKQAGLSALEEKLNDEHGDVIRKLRETFVIDIKAAIQHEKQTTADKMAYLEEKYSQLVAQICSIQPVLAQFVESYILLQKEVKQFPKMVNKTVATVTKQMTEAITGVSEYNKELVQKYQKEMKLRKKYHNELVELKGNIRVFCRVRPLIKEDGGGQQAEQVVSLDKDDSGLVNIASKGRTQTFDMDRVFGEESCQQEVFDEVKALVTSCIDGYNVCIFAYGQTGSGKTYTMEGTHKEPGINQRALQLLFEETSARVDWEYTITVSVIEIYNEMIRDLLGDDTSYKMEVKMNPDGGFHIPGLCYVHVKTVADVNECFRVGQQNRATAATNLNEHSSRSHALLCVTVIGFNKTTAARYTGKLNLVDLAGSERVSKSKADGARLKEAQSINKSLSSLGDVIFALRSKQSYIPYRNSKLTYLLQDSLGGDSKTLMIAQIAPVRKNEGETLCTLNFAQRVRNVELGAATKKLENGDGTEDVSVLQPENEQTSPSRTCTTPQRGYVAMSRSNTPTSAYMKPSAGGTPSCKPATPSSGVAMKSSNCSTPSTNPNMKSNTPVSNMTTRSNTPVSNMNMNTRSNTPVSNMSTRSNTPVSNLNINSRSNTPVSNLGIKPATPNSSNKLTPVRHARKKNEKF